MELDQIIDLGYELGMTQHCHEITNAASFLKEQNIKDFIEIGTDRGGTFLVWSKITPKDGLKVSIDWSHGPWGHQEYDVEKRNQVLQSMGEQVYVIEGDSHQEQMLYNLKDLMEHGNKKVDFLFIDGDHSHVGVKLDYHMYKEFVKPGGWIGFHDIVDSQFHRECGCFVSYFWEELQGNKISFLVEDGTWGGIGLIQTPV